MRPRWLVAIVGVALIAIGAFAVMRLAPGGPAGTPITGTPITIASGALGHDMAVQVFAPDSFEGTRSYPILYLFPGRGGDERSWMGGGSPGDGVGIDGIARSLIARGSIAPAIIVSVDIDDSYGVDSGPSDEGYDHGAYERYVIEDLIPQIEARYPNADHGRRFVGGLSMGGFAALHVAFRHPEMFAGVGALSPAIFEGTIPDRTWLYPDAGSRAQHDPLLLANTAPVSGKRFFVGWGDHDYTWIMSASRLLTDRLTAPDADLVQQVVPGGHENATWRALAPTMLAQLLPPE